MTNPTPTTPVEEALKWADIVAPAPSYFRTQGDEQCVVLASELRRLRASNALLEKALEEIAGECEERSNPASNLDSTEECGCTPCIASHALKSSREAGK